MIPKITVLIPARNEDWLAQTIKDILEHSDPALTEIIAVLDGKWADPPIADNQRVTIVYHGESVGQRAATNEAAKLARLRGSEWVMKCDAHCAFSPGFDRALLSVAEPDMTLVPMMRNLHVFDWVCQECGNRRYQGKIGTCPECEGNEERELVWRAKPSPRSTSYCFDPEPHFQYFGGFKKRPEGRGPLTETMSLQGSCWMITTERYFALNVCDERYGSWGSQGIEVAAKSWLSGGRVMCYKGTEENRCWYGHMFRTQGGSFGFPYPLKKRQTDRAKKMARDMFFVNGWDQEVRPLSWLVERFWPVRGWEQKDLDELKEREARRGISTSATQPKLDTAAILYYTDNRLDPLIATACQRQLERSSLPITSVSLQPLEFGAKNIVVDGERGPLTMFRQILAGLEAIDADIVFFAEHDVLYAPEHFDFILSRNDVFYYDQALWKCAYPDGRALFHYSNHTSMLCAYRSLLLEHYRERVRRVEQDGFSRRLGFEPGSHNRKERIDDYGCAPWMADVPSIDIRHGQNLTQTRWKRDQFRNQRYTKGWTEADEVPGWGRTKGRMRELLENI